MEYQLKKAVMTGASSSIGLALIRRLLDEDLENIVIAAGGICKAKIPA